MTAKRLAEQAQRTRDDISGSSIDDVSTLMDNVMALCDVVASLASDVAKLQDGTGALQQTGEVCTRVACQSRLWVSIDATLRIDLDAVQGVESRDAEFCSVYLPDRCIVLESRDTTLFLAAYEQRVAWRDDQECQGHLVHLAHGSHLYTSGM